MVSSLSEGRWTSSPRWWGWRWSPSPRGELEAAGLATRQELNGVGDRRTHPLGVR